MCDLISPYTPGAGFTPSYLAGRKKNIENAERTISAVMNGYPQRSTIYYGLRGVGKTVLLNRIEESAEDLNILYQHFEILEKNNFILQLTMSCGNFINNMSLKESVKAFSKKVIGIFKSFSVTYCPDDNTFGAGFNQDSVPYYTSGDLAMDLTELFVAMGKLAVKSNDTICLFIDEIQYLKETELEALTSAIHRINQLRLPILIFGAGLPKILKTFGEVKSYSERLFMFEEIGALTYEDTISAIQNPATELGVEYTGEALKKIYEITNGYPYFIQQLCNDIWELLNDKTVDVELVERATSVTFKILDKGFFAVRYDRATPQEREFMFSMVKCEKLPCTISNVAFFMKKGVASISPVRAQLIHKGLIYATGHAEIDFTVPQFDKYLMRINPTLEN